MNTLDILQGISDWVLEKNGLITQLIPSQATTSNQLADKAFVNSSIGTSTAAFQGDYHVVDDLGLAADASNSAIAAKLNIPASQTGAVVSKIDNTKMLNELADNQDYIYVRFGFNGGAITEIRRFKMSGSTWAYEFSLNNSVFTAEQWAAINSGITKATWLLTPSFEEEDPSETELVDEYASLLQQLYQAITDAQNAKADYVGDDNYVYHWDAVQGKYVKTDKYVKGDPGTTDYNQLQNKPSKLSQFQDDLGISPVHSHNQYGMKSEMSVTPGTGVNADKTTIQLKNGMTATVLVSHQSQASLVDNGSYNTSTKKIELKHGNTVLSEIDATAFIKDGMVNSVAISQGNLVITFNTDAGKEPISIPLTDIFNPANYYDKTAMDNLLANKANVADLSNAIFVEDSTDTFPF